jgi:hypothetical protein
VWVSAASGWEVAVKQALGKLTMSESFASMVGHSELDELPITLWHAEQLTTLPQHHADPFDRNARCSGPNRRSDRGDARERLRSRRAGVPFRAPGPSTNTPIVWRVPLVDSTSASRISAKSSSGDTIWTAVWSAQAQQPVVLVEPA